MRISGSNTGYTMFRGSVKSTGYPLHLPVSPSLSVPCVTVCQHISTGLQLPKIYPLYECHILENFKPRTGSLQCKFNGSKGTCILCYYLWPILRVIIAYSSVPQASDTVIWVAPYLFIIYLKLIAKILADLTDRWSEGNTNFTVYEVPVYFFLCFISLINSDLQRTATCWEVSNNQSYTKLTPQLRTPSYVSWS